MIRHRRLFGGLMALSVMTACGSGGETSERIVSSVTAGDVGGTDTSSSGTSPSDATASNGVDTSIADTTDRSTLLRTLFAWTDDVCIESIAAAAPAPCPGDDEAPSDAVDLLGFCSSLLVDLRPAGAVRGELLTASSDPGVANIQCRFAGLDPLSNTERVLRVYLYDGQDKYAVVRTDCRESASLTLVDDDTRIACKSNGAAVLIVGCGVQINLVFDQLSVTIRSEDSGEDGGCQTYPIDTPRTWTMSVLSSLGLSLPDSHDVFSLYEGG